ncbi:MAG TPA: P-loop NTPase, partial [Aeromicrobium sp.]|nr:P-loop NTPase [Aeromicrobium sp.]
MNDVLLIVGASDATAEQIAGTIGYRAVALSSATVAPPGVSLLRGLDPAQLPSVMVFTDEISIDRSLQMAAEVHVVRPDIDLVLIGEPDAQMVLEAMRSGIRDVAPSLEDAACLANLRSRLDARSGTTRGGSIPPPPGPVDFASRTMTVFSPKGGVGKTTLSVNLAVALAEMSPMEVVLVDLDL